MVFWDSLTMFRASLPMPAVLDLGFTSAELSQIPVIQAYLKLAGSPTMM